MFIVLFHMKNSELGLKFVLGCDYEWIVAAKEDSAPASAAPPVTLPVAGQSRFWKAGPCVTPHHTHAPLPPVMPRAQA